MLTRVKFILAAVGIVLAVIGVTQDNKFSVWIAILILAAAVVLRFIARRQKPSQP